MFPLLAFYNHHYRWIVDLFPIYYESINSILYLFEIWLPSKKIGKNSV